MSKSNMSYILLVLELHNCHSFPFPELLDNKVVREGLGCLAEEKIPGFPGKQIAHKPLLWCRSLHPLIVQQLLVFIYIFWKSQSFVKCVRLIIAFCCSLSKLLVPLPEMYNFILALSCLPLLLFSFHFPLCLPFIMCMPPPPFPTTACFY